MHLYNVYIHVPVNVMTMNYDPLDPTIPAEDDQEVQLIHLAVFAKGTDSDFTEMLKALKEIE